MSLKLSDYKYIIGTGHPPVDAKWYREMIAIHHVEQYMEDEDEYGPNHPLRTTIIPSMKAEIVDVINGVHPNKTANPGGYGSAMMDDYYNHMRKFSNFSVPDVKNADTPKIQDLACFKYPNLVNRLAEGYKYAVMIEEYLKDMSKYGSKHPIRVKIFPYLTSRLRTCMDKETEPGEVEDIVYELSFCWSVMKTWDEYHTYKPISPP